MTSLTPQRMTAVGLLALVPVVVYTVGTDRPIVAISAVSVLIIALSLYLIFSPGESELPTAGEHSS